jgi:triosephosphate isomerase (TIM)
MKKGIPPLVIGNWKMNPQSGILSTRLASDLKKVLTKIVDVDVVVAPPSVYLDAVRRVQNGKVFMLGAQNVHTEKMGSHTGEVSLTMLKDFGVQYVILGHSERRGEGETDDQVNQKLTATIKGQCIGVVCVGEKSRDHSAHYLGDIEMQIRKALAGIPKAKLEQVVIAYEPIWAIGTGNTATPHDVHEMKLFIEKVISDIYGRNLAQKVRIIYGGSVNAKNAQELFTEGMVDGFLVGGASLHADEFASIIKFARNI